MPGGNLKLIMLKATHNANSGLPVCASLLPHTHGDTHGDTQYDVNCRNTSVCSQSLSALSK